MRNSWPACHRPMPRKVLWMSKSSKIKIGGKGKGSLLSHEAIIPSIPWPFRLMIILFKNLKPEYIKGNLKFAKRHKMVNFTLCDFRLNQ